MAPCVTSPSHPSAEVPATPKSGPPRAVGRNRTPQTCGVGAGRVAGDRPSSHCGVQPAGSQGKDMIFPFFAVLSSLLVVGLALPVLLELDLNAPSKLPQFAVVFVLVVIFPRRRARARLTNRLFWSFYSTFLVIPVQVDP